MENESKKSVILDFIDGYYNEYNEIPAVRTIAEGTGIALATVHKDFTPVIEKALGGYPTDMRFTGINGGEKVLTGFGHNTVLSVADTVIEAVKSGAIKHFFLIGSCDGAKPGRNYYTEFVKQTPPDNCFRPTGS